eukprot:726867-Pleurochrysis_carterae.AAC.1
METNKKVPQLTAVKQSMQLAVAYRNKCVTHYANMVAAALHACAHCVCALICALLPKCLVAAGSPPHGVRELCRSGSCYPLQHGYWA